MPTCGVTFSDFHTSRAGFLLVHKALPMSVLDGYGNGGVFLKLLVGMSPLGR